MVSGDQGSSGDALILKKKRFDELTTTELYEILRARVAVFVVEQQCTAQEVDGRDYDSLHVFYEQEDGQVAACLRIFEREEGTIQIGRVLTVKRGQGLGRKLLKEGVREALNRCLRHSATVLRLPVRDFRTGGR